MHQAAVRHGTRILRLGSIALAVGLAATLFVALTPGDAYAHGSRYAPPPQPDPPPPPPPPPEAFGEPKRGPVGKPPPPSPGRRPGPITPPSRPGVLPPQYGDPPNPVTPGPGARTPPPTVTPPTPTPPVTTPPTTGGRRPPIRTPLGAKLGGGRTVARSQNGESTWQMWWALNRLAYLPDRIEAELGEATVTPRDGDLDPNTQWATRRAFVAGRHIVPLLLKLTDPKAKVRDDVRASALIALGKICRTSAVTERMFHWLEDERASQLVRESAALAVGLVARTAEDRQFGPQFLDTARDRLLQAFDDPDMPYRARVFAVLAIGLLGDQPYTGPYAKDGRLITRALWKRLEDHHAHRGMTVALLTAIGQQPRSRHSRRRPRGSAAPSSPDGACSAASGIPTSGPRPDRGPAHRRPRPPRAPAPHARPAPRARRRSPRGVRRHRRAGGRDGRRRARRDRASRPGGAQPESRPAHDGRGANRRRAPPRRGLESR